MRVHVRGVTYNTQSLIPVLVWFNALPPDAPRYQRFLVYRTAPDGYLLLVRTGPARGQLNHATIITGDQLGRLRVAVRYDRRRSLRLTLQTLDFPQLEALA